MIFIPEFGYFTKKPVRSFSKAQKVAKIARLMSLMPCDPFGQVRRLKSYKHQVFRTDGIKGCEKRPNSEGENVLMFS